ncbi:hypothetical protein CKO36_12100 [Rhabdochromatium marinum]|nr:hypothetical protein [Rhabdochromatium marinum]
MSLRQTARRTTLVLACTLYLAAPFAQAQPDSQGGQRHGPPPEAFDACADQLEGAVCQFTGRRGKSVEGTCFTPPGRDGELVCAPEGGPSHQRGQPS